MMMMNASILSLSEARVDWFHPCLRERKNWSIDFIRRCVRSELCSVNIKTFAKCAILTTIGFSTIPHVIRIIILHQLLPSVSAAAETIILRLIHNTRVYRRPWTRAVNTGRVGGRPTNQNFLTIFCGARGFYIPDHRYLTYLIFASNLLQST